MFLLNFVALVSISTLLVVTANGQFVFLPGPLVPSTKGQVWPQPQNVDNADPGYYTLIPFLNVFNFKVVGNNCRTLEEALDRYKDIILNKNRYVKKIYYEVTSCANTTDKNFLGYLTNLEVDLKGSCDDKEYPPPDMKEEYVLNVTSKTRKLSSESLWGILRGLESFSQLVYLIDDHSCHRVDTVNIHDFPRFSYRGFMLDTSRHYEPDHVILKMLDGMAYNKLNVFHWHIVDDYSFPYESYSFPELSEKGAFNSKIWTYSQKFVREVIEYARKRGIRVIPEFDTPGHTLSWGLGGVAGLLTNCVNVPMLKWGPIDPTKQANYDFIFKLFEEIREVFRDSYVHLGGDEVDFSCWKSNAGVETFMAQRTISSYVDLQSYYTQRLINYTSNALGFSNIVWEEVFTNGVKIPQSTVVEVWTATDPQGVIANVTKAGFPAIQSAYYYLDQLETGPDWMKYWNADPQDFDGDDAQKKLVLGGELCMWGESVDEHNVFPRAWPRASAGAERFWSAQSTFTITDQFSTIPVAIRLQEQTCRMIRRGIDAQPPAGPNFCY